MKHLAGWGLGSIRPWPRRRRATRGIPNGSVYVFNMFSETMTLFSTNGREAGVIASWSDGGAGQPFAFTPAGLAVGRVVNRNDSPGRFWNGKNPVLLQWPSGVFSFDLTIDGVRLPVIQDLVLNVQYGRWQLLDSTGVVVQSGALESKPASLLNSVIRTSLDR